MHQSHGRLTTNLKLPRYNYQDRANNPFFEYSPNAPGYNPGQFLTSRGVEGAGKSDILPFIVYEVDRFPSTVEELEDWRGVQPQFSFCPLNFCAHFYTNISVNNGVYTPGAVTHRPLEYKRNVTRSGTLFWVYGTTPDDHTPYAEFNISQVREDYFRPAQVALANLLAVFVNQTLTPDVLDAVYGMRFAGDRVDFSRTIGAIGDAVTLLLRTSAYSRLVDVEGEAYNAEPYVRVRWVWLLLPLGLLVGSAGLLGVTMWSASRRTHLWKASGLARILAAGGAEVGGQENRA
ncbi:hypothetical protein BDV95DRAFT_658168 [Massariosphaeria phaeospora]|uniref:Uncharacterized protein n=1 Tax=Massariosphaeria phaeospora TaxID=100035 RepID=A0A7C8IH77_9PLEO|nr:hypothetical protein BDV95DRAFT_658168 [Massariosphaeria phaeospora]